MNSLVFALVIASAATGQWSWRQTRPYGDVYTLSHRGAVVGRWDARSGSYFPAVGPGVYAVSEGVPPIDPPRINHGLDQRRLEDGERWQIKGQTVDRESALKAIDRAGGVAAITGSPAPLRVVLTGGKDHCDRAAAVIGGASQLAQLRERYRVDAFPDDAWQCKVGYAGPQPSCWVVRSSGKVEHLQDGTDGLGAALAAVLRDPDPAFRRDRVPDRRRLLSPWSLPQIPATGLVIVAALVAVLAVGWGVRR